ncbi:hypothetical protein HPP92_003457 [Vanilla planifolia]|uniref:MOM1 alpha-helical domain-containing protein n=1 Tax=Vanilla planifolia TaxID=51239 RepID=A0A835S2C1_VANPL|nr:hypothetical protein HPP92_003457 [Vanilla planifolia]
MVKGIVKVGCLVKGGGKTLVLAKEDTLLDSDVQNISRSSAHSLLGWGASHLFYKLDQFHSSGRPTCISEPSFDKVHLDDVISDIFSVLPGNDVTTRAVSVLIKAQQVGATYSRNIILIGEKEDVHKDSMLESDGGTPKLEEQRNLLMLLRPELSELCDILALPDPVKDMAQEFLVYIMNNHDVSSKQVTVLQALMISLCWRAASISKHSLQRIGSLALAKRLMKFECSIEEARSVYSRPSNEIEEGLLPIYSEVAIAHSEVSPLSRDPANLITDSIAVAAVDAGQRECRGNSNERHLLLNSVMNEGACHSSLLNAVINEGAASTSSSQRGYKKNHNWLLSKGS